MVGFALRDRCEWFRSKRTPYIDLTTNFSRFVDQTVGMEEAARGALFVGGPDAGEFPRRFGYYVGLRVIEELGGQYQLAELATMPPQTAKVALNGAINRLVTKAAGCRKE